MPRADVTIRFAESAPAFAYPVGARTRVLSGGVTAAGISNPIAVNISGASITGQAGASYENNYPRLGSFMISERVYAEDNVYGDYMRTAISLVDNVTLGMYADGPWDTGDSRFLSRAEVVDDLKAKNPNLIIMDYTDLMEGGIGGDFGAVMNGTSSDPTYAGSGTAPGGLDWFAYEDADTAVKGDVNTMVSTYPNSYNRNITTYVYPANNGWYVPQCYANYSDEKKLAPHVGNSGVGPGGMNLYCDVFDRTPRSDVTDFNLDGNRLGATQYTYTDGERNGQERARSYYDPANSTHMANPIQNPGLCVEISQEWRGGQRDYILAIKARYPDIICTCNATTWSREYISGAAPAMLSEYVDLIEGGIQEAQSQPDATNRYPFSGVASDGGTHTTGAAGFGKWIRAQNAYTYLMDNMIGRKLVCNDWWIEFNNLRITTDPFPGNGWNSSTNKTPGGYNFYDAYPESSPAWNLVRWSLASTLMNNGYHCISGINAGTFSGYFGVCVHVDEYGTTNQSTTGLYKGWGGQPLQNPVTSPNLQGNLYMREFQNMLVVLNPEWDDTKSAQTVLVSNLPGGAGAWRRFQGVNDPTTNDGSVVNSNFSLSPIDARIFVRNT